MGNVTSLICGLSDEDKRKYILWAYGKSGGFSKRAADLLHMHKRNFLHLVNILGLTEEVARRWPIRERVEYYAQRNAAKHTP